MSDRLYQACYCEENIWHLAQRDDLGLGRRRVLVVSNPARQVALWCQRASEQPGGLAVWDYHVVLVVGRSLWDLDTTLPVPSPVDAYLEATYRPAPARFTPRFRVVDAEAFCATFASDRHHMRAADGNWRSPPPSWPCIGSGHTLDRFLDLDDAFVGDIVDLPELEDRLAEDS